MKSQRTLIAIAIILGIAVIAVAAIYAFGFRETKVANTNAVNENSVMASDTNTAEANTNESDDSEASSEHSANANFNSEDVVFQQQKKSAHFETSTPNHEEIAAAVPINVVINFNFDLSTISTISILKDGQEYGTGSTTVDANKLALRRTMNPDSPDGTYTVKYNACWPDNSCHDGQFEFVIDRSKKETFQDLRGESTVTISLADVMIEPKEIRISKGTKVIWQNDDEVGHYINTDSHPAHTYFPEQNSQELHTGDQYSVTFDTPGYYPYHCSAHAHDMTGTIVVE